jgi:hypothetical protein
MNKGLCNIVILVILIFSLIFLRESTLYAQDNIAGQTDSTFSNRALPDSGLSQITDTNAVKNSMPTDTVQAAVKVDTTTQKVPNSADTLKNTEAPIVPASDSILPVVTPEASTNVVTQPIIVPEGQAKDTTEKNIYQAVKINEQMIDAFNKFLEQNYPGDYERYVVDYSSLNFSDIQSIKKAWYQHLYDDKYYIALGEDSTTQPILAVDTIVVADTTKHQIEPVEFVAQQNSDKENKLKKSSKHKRDITANRHKNITERTINEKPINEKSLSPTYSSHLNIPDTALAKGFMFTVQILACRVQVTQNELKRVYTGDLIVTERFEDNWYKYTIGTYNSFAIARKLRMVCGSNGAFVAAYLNGVRLNPRDALVKPDNSTTENTIAEQPGIMTYKVQVAACRYEMADTSLSKIYSNTSELQKLFEDNWYKYVIDCGSDMEKAKEILKNIGVQGAFIALYKDNVRIKR